MVHQGQGFLLVQIDVRGLPVAGEGGEVDVLGADGDGLPAQPGQIAQAQVRLHILLEDLHKAVHLGQIGHGESLLGNGFQKVLLGLHPPQVLAAVAGAVVVVAEANHLQGVGAA